MPNFHGDITVFSQQEVAAYGTEVPGASYLNALIRDYALEKGGRVLTVWQKLEGPLFGDNISMGPVAVARELDLPFSEVEAIRRQAVEAVEAVWTASPQYAEYQMAKRDILAKDHAVLSANASDA